MERSEMLAKVAEVAADVLGINEDEITEETTFDDLDAAPPAGFDDPPVLSPCFPPRFSLL